MRDITESLVVANIHLRQTYVHIGEPNSLNVDDHPSHMRDVSTFGTFTSTQQQRAYETRKR
ncbi:hypothetical protein BU24DRAFT_422716 [Aaosphaeria arxii CBS 175.79]|uniref:Uncharacterized protein n=1 Tax=Aaosphaeria arxii CBS 175.79 TaxID=1450172 RepID=A0A6A5XTS9_9PLEO|nr:uncharacterized protein BU24DRAFT_422716 [Aaosphaeria arxii CBS 175.79]KAF2016363.1 hypothetical protein BU24DRAFT_422716 [Aaosphaeria arxii CBS 175.79]